MLIVKRSGFTWTKEEQFMDKKKPKRSSKDIENYIDSVGDDYEPEGRLGHDPEQMATRPAKRKGGDIRTIRIDDEFLADIKQAAQDEGFDNYQTFIKVILKRYIKDKQKKAN
jgi:predicted DNA binding CopG/RHH family protein